MRPSRALPTGTSERSSVAGAPGAATVNGVVCFAGGRRSGVMTDMLALTLRRS
jgi:hypothetical protein